MTLNLLRRCVKFGISGGITTVVTYSLFSTLTPTLGYFWAATAGWLAGLASGFALNRRFTFGISGRDGRSQQFAAFTLGAMAQYGLAMAGYWVLIDFLDLRLTLAFAINLVATSAFGFAFQSLAVFQRHKRADIQYPSR